MKSLISDLCWAADDKAASSEPVTLKSEKGGNLVSNGISEIGNPNGECDGFH